MNVIAHLSALETAGLVRLAQVMPELEYLFRHTLVQDAAYASLLDDDQARLHQEVGLALEALYADRLDEFAPTLARHFERAGDCERARRYFGRAAARALQSYANQEAERHFRSALALTEQETQRVELLDGLGEALYRQSRFTDAIGAWNQAIDAYRRLGCLDELARLYARSARAAWFAQDTARGLEICLEGLQAAAGAGEGPGLAGLLHETARAYYFNNRRAEAHPLCRQALAMAERLGNVEVQADANATLGLMPDLADAERLALLERAVELTEGAGLLQIAVRAHINLGSALREFKHDLDGSRKHFLRAAEIARRRGALQEELMARNGSAHILLNLGQLEQMDAELDELEALEKLLPTPKRVSWQTVTTRAMGQGMRGDWNAVVRTMRKLHRVGVESGDVFMRLRASDVLAGSLVSMYELGKTVDLYEFEAQFQQDLEMAEQAGRERALWLAAHLSQLRGYQGQFEQAEALLERARSLGEADEIETTLALSETEIRLSAARGRPQDALPMFEKIIQYEKILDPFYSAAMRMMWANALMGRGEVQDLEKAQALLLEAQRAFEALKSWPYVQLVRQRLESSRSQTYAQAAAQQKVADEVERAGKMQGSFLPIQPPRLLGWQIAAALQPARATSGDYYDFIPLEGGRIGFVVADVADKGMSAALYMASSRSLLRAYATEVGGQPAQTLARANARLTADTHGGLFVTLFYGILDPVSGEMVYANAGHNPPYLLQPDSEPLRLENTGIPIGIFAEAEWREKRVVLQPGSLLLLYTDGVTEANNPEQALFGEERLLQAIYAGLEQERHSPPGETPQPAQAALEQVLQAIHTFRGAAAQADDITVVAISRAMPYETVGSRQ